jgi:carbon starvation protein CstA
LLLVSVWRISEGKKAGWVIYPMIFMFITTITALLYTSYDLLHKVFTGAAKGTEAVVGNTVMGCAGFFLVITAVMLAWDGVKALRRYRGMKLQPTETVA